TSGLTGRSVRSAITVSMACSSLVVTRYSWAEPPDGGSYKCVGNPGALFVFVGILWHPRDGGHSWLSLQVTHQGRCLFRVVARAPFQRPLQPADVVVHIERKQRDLVTGIEDCAAQVVVHRLVVGGVD